MIKREILLPTIQEKLKPSVERFLSDTGSEHDIFPSLLWLLLQGEESLHERVKEIDKARGADKAAIESLIRDLAVEHSRQVTLLDDARSDNRAHAREQTEAIAASIGNETRGALGRVQTAYEQLSTIVSQVSDEQKRRLEELAAIRTNDRELLQNVIKGFTEEVDKYQQLSAAKLNEIAGLLNSTFERMGANQTKHLQELNEARSRDRAALEEWVKHAGHVLSEKNADTGRKLLEIAKTIGDLDGLNKRVRLMTVLAGLGVAFGIATSGLLLFHLLR